MKPATLREALRIGQPGLLMDAMNELNVNLQHSILTLAGNGCSNRRIAREQGISRETVGKYLVLARSNPAISPPGSEPDPNQNQPFRPPGQRLVARAFASAFTPDSGGGGGGLERPTYLSGFGL
jgi:hypothetical protein